MCLPTLRWFFLASLSRAFFKLVEICNTFDLFKDSDPIKSFHLAEGPGGFLQYLSSKYTNANIYGMTLLSKDRQIPYWSPIIIKNENINLLYGVENDGDLYKLNNIESIINTIDKCDLITADGGIDYSLNYNNQEILSYKLLYCEIFSALNLQKDKGVFIIKFFDILYYNTIQLLYILYLCYEEIIIYKPDTSRFSNSEKYIICKNYTKNEDVIKLMYDNFKSPNNLNIYIPLSFIKNIENSNELYIKKQIENIELIINNINDNNTNIKNSFYKKQIIMAKNWCEKYNLPINNILLNL